MKQQRFYDNQVEGLNVLRNLFIVCAIISLLITILGIYHSIQIDTERRQKEVAIRKVNAHISDIYWLFGKSYVMLLSGGNDIGRTDMPLSDDYGRQHDKSSTTGIRCYGVFNACCRHGHPADHQLAHLQDSPHQSGRNYQKNE